MFPPHASRSDGLFIADAYTDIFAVHPSTKARLSPTEQPRYVATNGTLLGTVDYRVEVPADQSNVTRRVDAPRRPDSPPRRRLC